MSRKRIDELPNELIITICSYLSGHHRQELFAFGAVNKKVREAAKIYIFQKVSVRPGELDEIRPVVRRWMEILDSNDAWAYIRTIKVSLPRHKISGMPVRDLNIKSSVPVRRQWDDKSQLEWGTSYYTKRREQKLFSWAISGTRAEHYWSLFVILFDQAPNLSHFVWNCQKQLPRVVFRSLMYSHPQCRLTVENLSLDTPLGDELNKYIHELVRSPMLYKITVDMPPTLQGEHKGAIAHINSMAPNLRELTVVLSLSEREFAPIFPEPHCASQIPDSHRLEKLTLIRTGILTNGRMIFDGTIREEVLKELILDIQFDADSWSWLASNCHFTSLKKLEIKIMRRGQEGVPPRFQAPLQSFFRSLPGLKSLFVYGSVHEELMDEISLGQSATLQELFLDTYESAVTAVTVPRMDTSNTLPWSFFTSLYKFQFLERLRIPITRTDSQTEERHYREVARAPALRHLTILLHCHMFGPATWLYDKESLQDAFNNAAIDTGLVYSIWNTVSAVRHGVRLRSLRIKPTLPGLLAYYAGTMYDTPYHATTGNSNSTQFTITATEYDEVEEEVIKWQRYGEVEVTRKRFPTRFIKEQLYTRVG